MFCSLLYVSVSHGPCVAQFGAYVCVLPGGSIWYVCSCYLVQVGPADLHPCILSCWYVHYLYYPLWKGHLAPKRGHVEIWN